MTQANSAARELQPVPAEKVDAAAQLIEGLDAFALNWLSGYMAGAAAQLRSGPVAVPTPVTAPASDQRLTILYGSQTGNAKRVAEQLAEEVENAGLPVRVVRADAYRTNELKKERFLYVVISTHSEGDTVEPPDDSRGFCEFLLGRRAPKLKDLSYAVLALGDSSYADFCGIGRQVDERLAELGGTRVLARSEADVDVDSVSGPWAKQAFEQAQEQLKQDVAPVHHGVVTPLRPAKQAWTRQRPFAAEVLANQRIVASSSDKDVHHIELSLEDSGIRYQPGDALGVWPTQAPELVDAVLETLALDGTTEVEYEGECLPLSQWLRERRELTVLTRPFVTAHAQRGEHADLQALLQPDNNGKLAELLNSQHLIDLLRSHPVEWSAQDLVAALRPLAPRMYSIASSQTQFEDEVHLTVVRFGFEQAEEQRWGVGSRYLCDLEEGTTAPVFIDANDRFRLPADGNTDVIMVGPGTGVAPFRAFLQQRQEDGAEGRNWLFFGNPHRRSDFLYQIEWLQALKEGSLTKLDVAFSRDQAEKVYVQHRLRENGADVWAWLDDGAHLYVCGDADRMAPDVNAALIDIAVEHGGHSPDTAATWLKALMTEGRYARDVY